MNPSYIDKYEAFRAALKKARIDQGLTQKVVAERLNVPQSFVSKYENGERRLDMVEFIDVAVALEVEPFDVLKSAKLIRPARKQR